ncbi:hypothetical protein FO519_000107 [Halicephalobus sp. NKZ332]|nr:hypothetical protein FO519_000107 [Halicephalobus sp. NKZ332]
MNRSTPTIKSKIGSTVPISRIVELIRELKSSKKRSAVIVSLRDVCERCPEAATTLWSNQSVIKLLMDDLGNLIYPFMNGNFDPDNLQVIFNILGILHSICKDKRLTKKFADSEIPGSCLRLVFLEKNFQVDCLKPVLLMFPFTILKSSQEWAAKWFVETEVLRAILVTLTKPETWEVMKLCVYIIRLFVATETGLNYIRRCVSRFHAIDYVFEGIVKKIAVKSVTHSIDYELYRNIIEVYIRLTDDMELCKTLAFADLAGSLNIYSRIVIGQDPDSAELYGILLEKLNRRKIELPGTNLIGIYGLVMGQTDPNRVRTIEEKYQYLNEQLRYMITFTPPDDRSS